MSLSIRVICCLAFLGAASCSQSEQSGSSTKETEKKPAATQAKEVSKTMEATPAASTDPAARRHPVRSDKNNFVTIATDFGNMTLELYRDVAPAHADSFLSLTKKGFYNGTLFHRIMQGFIIQGGDPEGTGMGNAGYFLKAEFNQLPHVEGTLSMARSPNDTNSASCQFFVCLGNAGFLDGKYTVFGHLVKGYDVLRKIGAVPVTEAVTREKSKPVEPVYAREVFASNAEGERLK